MCGLSYLSDSIHKIIILCHMIYKISNFTSSNKTDMIMYVQSLMNSVNALSKDFVLKFICFLTFSVVEPIKSSDFCPICSLHNLCS